MTTENTASLLTVYDRVENLPPVWDVLARTGGMSFSKPYLRVVQQSAVDGNSRRYLVYQTPTGAAVIAVIQVFVKPCLHNPVTDILLGRLSGRLAAGRNWLLPMILLRPVLSGDPPIVTAAKTDRERTATLLQMLAALEKHAIHEGCLLAVSGVFADDVALIGALRQSGYLQTEGRPVAELYLHWDSWEAFLQYAGSRRKNAAAGIRNEVNRARREGVTFVEWDPESIPETTLYRLLDEHERRQNQRGFRFREDFLSTLTESLGNNTRVLLALGEKGHVQGVTVFACEGRRGYVLFAGLIEKAERTGFAYFNMVYYQPIRLAIELGLDSLAYGNGAFAAKIRRGATVAATGLFMRPRHALTRAVLGGPIALHRRLLQQKYAPILQASAFSSLQ